MRNLTDYIKNPVHKKIAEVYGKARTPEELESARQYQNQIVDAMTPEEKEVYERELVEDHYRMLAAMDEDISVLRAEVIRKKLGDTPRFINWTQIATTYFGKSQSWLMQRLNGNKVNGKEAIFSEQEAKQLETALHDIGKKLSAISLV